MITKLQQFIFKELNQTVITSKVSGVYYQVISNSYFPYIYVGDFNSKNISTKDREYAEITFSINIYFRDKNLKPMLEVAKLIKEVLLNGEIYIKYIDEKILQQLDGITQQIIITYKAKLMGEVYV